PSAGRVTVDYATCAGTAKPGEDYIETSGTLVFEDGEERKEIQVSVIDDDLAEEDENFFCTLTNCVGGHLDADRAEVVIIDDD
ncbi:unnamed protein product, partial [Discosporangium mesarthrocarpum]